MLTENYYHNGYVTHNLDGALEIFESRFGISDFVTSDATFNLKTPAGEQSSSVRIALRPGIELIQPVSGFQDQVTSYLPRDSSDPSPRLNHIALRRGDLASMRKEIHSLGLPVILETERPGVVVTIYVDARAELGHYLEFIWHAPSIQGHGR